MSLQRFGELKQQQEEMERLKQQQRELFGRAKDKRLNQRDRERNLRGYEDKDSEIVKLKRHREIQNKKIDNLLVRIKELEREIKNNRNKIEGFIDKYEDIPKEEDIETIEI